MTLREQLAYIHANCHFRVWAGERTATQAWTDCQRPDWLIEWRLLVHPDDLPAVVLIAKDRP